jgi:hypothetical protein
VEPRSSYSLRTLEPATNDGSRAHHVNDLESVRWIDLSSIPLGVQVDPDGCRANHRTFPNSCCCRATSDIASDLASSSLPIRSSVSKERAISRCCCNRAFSSRFG